MNATYLPSLDSFKCRLLDSIYSTCADSASRVLFSEALGMKLTMVINIYMYTNLLSIVLESGYFLDNRAFFENLVTILIYAVIVSLYNVMH